MQTCCLKRMYHRDHFVFGLYPPPEISSEWETDLVIYDYLNSRFKFGLDAAASPDTAKHHRYCHAARALTIRFFSALENTLKVPLHLVAKIIFCNPPYGTAYDK
jgi:hypothetical protein